MPGACSCDLNPERSERVKTETVAEAVADELAGMAGLACGKLTNRPACIIRGFDYTAGAGSARQLIRPRKRDLFR